MVARPDIGPMTVEEYQALTRQDSDVRYEYIDGHVYAMASGTLDHSAIGGNIVAALGDLLENTPCRVYNSDAKVQLSATRYVFPDATVTCDPHDQGTEEENVSPRVVFEVLSESTEARDRGRKFRWYRGCPSVEEYVLVATERRQVEVFRRRHDAEIWEFTAYAPDDVLDLRSLGIALSVARLYRNTTIPTADESH